jgi:hypothetical protein
MKIRKRKKLFVPIFLLTFLLVLTFFIAKNDTDNFPQSEIYNSGLLLAGEFFTNDEVNIKPVLKYINLDNNFSLENIALERFNLNFTGIHEARPILINNEYKIALGTYSPLFENIEQTEFVILSSDSSGFDNLEIEFKEQIDDLRIRAIFVGDIDNDDEKEIVIGTRPHGILKYYKFIDNKWRAFDIDFLNEAIHDILITDTNRNGRNEILITASKIGFDTPENTLQNIESTGRIISYEFNPDKNSWQKQIIWEYTDFFYLSPETTIPDHARYIFSADVDGDGFEEIIVNVIGSRNIELFRWDGLSYLREIVEDSLDVHDSAITVGDIDGDGRSEIISLIFPQNTFVIYNYNNKNWERETLKDDLFENKDIIDQNTYLYFFKSPSDSYGKILYATLHKEGASDIFSLYYLERVSDDWNKKYIGTTKQPLKLWGIFSASPN